MNFLVNVDVVQIHYNNFHDNNDRFFRINNNYVQSLDLDVSYGVLNDCVFHLIFKFTHYFIYNKNFDIFCQNHVVIKEHHYVLHCFEPNEISFVNFLFDVNSQSIYHFIFRQSDNLICHKHVRMDQVINYEQAKH